MTTRGSYTLTYDAENRLTAISGPATASFVYDADGGRVKATFGATSTIYVGSHYEKTGNAVTKYYYAGGRRIAMRTGGQTYYLFPDHLGSTHITTNSSGVELDKLLYKPWGERRNPSGTTLTTWRFTGQREDATIGLYFYNARYYDPQLGRFAQADTIVPNPGDPQALNRYSYVLNNALKYQDPTGHQAVSGVPAPPPSVDWLQIIQVAEGLSVTGGPEAVALTTSIVMLSVATVYGTGWAMQDIGPDYQVAVEYEAGAVQSSLNLPSAGTLAIDTVMVADQGSLVLPARVNPEGNRGE